MVQAAPGADPDYFSQGDRDVLKTLKDKADNGWSDMEWQMRNWLYFTWLSGDHIVEQAIHSIDKMLWAMKDEPPASVVCVGGRQARPGALPPGKYYVLATDLPVDKSPECIGKLALSRSKAQEVDLGANGSAQVTLAPTPIN